MFLNAKNVFINAQDTKGDTPLSLALKNGHTKVAELIQDRLRPKEEIMKSINKWGVLFQSKTKNKDDEQVDEIIEVT